MLRVSENVLWGEHYRDRAESWQLVLLFSSSVGNHQCSLFSFYHEAIR